MPTTDPRIQAAEIVAGSWFHYEPYTCTDLAQQMLEAVDAAAPWYTNHEKLALTAAFMAKQQDDLPPSEVLDHVLYMLEKPWKHGDDYNLAQAEQELDNA